LRRRRWRKRRWRGGGGDGGGREGGCGGGGCGGGDGGGGEDGGVEGGGDAESRAATEKAEGGGEGDDGKGGGGEGVGEKGCGGNGGGGQGGGGASSPICGPNHETDFLPVCKLGAFAKIPVCKPGLCRVQSTNWTFKTSSLQTESLSLQPEPAQIAPNKFAGGHSSRRDTVVAMARHARPPAARRA
jgi:hypothetical protein